MNVRIITPSSQLALLTKVLFQRTLIGVAKKMNKGGKVKTLHLYLIHFCEQHSKVGYNIIKKSTWFLMFSCKQYVTMTMLKPSHVNVELVVNKIAACLNGIWRIIIMENHL